MRLTEVLNIEKNSVVSIVGAGGKTTLMFQLAKELREKGRILITTTTKIYVPEEGEYDFLIIGNPQEKKALEKEEAALKSGVKEDVRLQVRGKEEAALKARCNEKYSFQGRFNEAHELLKNLKSSENGIWVYGESINEEDKLTAVDDEKLSRIAKYFDYILIEADGSKGKALKGWREDEPVVSGLTNYTIGVLNGQTLGLEISEDNIHRLARFLGKPEGMVDEEDLIKVIFHPEGMFNHSKGEKILFINKIDKEEIQKRNCNLLGEIINENFYEKAFHKIIEGSLKEKVYFKIQNAEEN